MSSKRLPATRTLGQIAAELTGESKAGNRLNVDEAVARKPLCVYGAKFVDANRLIRAIARIYGLDVQTPDDRKFAITLPRLRSSTSAPEIGEELRRLVPEPLLRYLSAQGDIKRKSVTADRLKRRERNGRPRINSPRLLEYMRQSDMGLGKFLASDSGYFPAVRRLIALAEPEVPTPKSDPVPVAEIGPEAERLIALILLSGTAMRDLDNLQNFSIPACLTEPNTLAFRLFRVVKPNQEGIVVAFGQFGSDGKFQGKIGTNYSHAVKH